MADDTKQPETQTDDEVTEAHLAAYEQHASDPNLVRLLRHLGRELMRVRGGGKASTPPGRSASTDQKGDS